METNVGEALYKAADYIDAHGWCKGSHKDKDGHVCARGAIACALNAIWVSEAKRLFIIPDDYDGCFFYKVCQQLAETLSVQSYQIVDWNDQPGRTADEVTAALRAAAALWTAQNAQKPAEVIDRVAECVG